MIHGVFAPTLIHIALHFPKTRQLNMKPCYVANLGALKFFPIIYGGFLLQGVEKMGSQIGELPWNSWWIWKKALTLKMLKTNFTEFLQIHTLSYYQIYMFFFFEKVDQLQKLVTPMFGLVLCVFMLFPPVHCLYRNCIIIIVLQSNRVVRVSMWTCPVPQNRDPNLTREFKDLTFDDAELFPILVGRICHQNIYDLVQIW